MGPRTLSAARCLLVATSVLVAAVACGSSKKTEDKAPATTSQGGTDSGHPPPKPPDCKNPTPYLVNNLTTGFVKCEGGSMHREGVAACVSSLPRTQRCGAQPSSDGGLLGSCHADTDCSTKPFGYCTSTSRSAYCYCDYGCAQDSDCQQGQLCECSLPVGKCQSAACKSDADCGAGLLCLRTRDTTCGFIYACEAGTDLCTSDSDCKPPYGQCTYDHGKRSCTVPTTCP